MLSWYPYSMSFYHDDGKQNFATQIFRFDIFVQIMRVIINIHLHIGRIEEMKYLIHNTWSVSQFLPTILNTSFFRNVYLPMVYKILQSDIFSISSLILEKLIWNKFPILSRIVWYMHILSIKVLRFLDKIFFLSYAFWEIVKYLI